MDTDNTPTITVRPDDPPNQDATDKADRRLSFTDMVKRWRALGYTRAAAEGIADNMVRESGGDPTAIGDGGTSRGLFQHHADRKTALEAFAKERATSPDDPDTQIAFADQELRTKFPRLRAQLLTADDRGKAEDQFKRVFERPASVMWANAPKLGTDRYRFSDYAMNEHGGRKNTDLLYMRPQDYLDLSPDLDGEPFKSRAGRSLLASFNRGDAIEAVPTLNIRVDGPTATVTAQDGRHRALLAQQEGVDQIPVAVTRTGNGQPSEVVGMSGNVVPHDFTPASDVRSEKAAGSLVGRLVNAVIPGAEAAEPGNPFAKYVQQDDNPFAKYAPAASQAPQMSRAERFGTGLRDPVEAGAQLVTHMLPESVVQAGNRVNNWLADKTGLVGRLPEGGVDQEVRDREAAIQAASPPGTDWWRMAGNAAGTVPLAAFGGAAAPATAMARIGGATLGGALGGATQPVTEGGGFWGEKAKQAAAGAATGAVLGTAGNMLAKAVAPAFKGAVQTLMREGVELTPGQMAGGAAKAVEDKMMSMPVTGDAIAAARRRSFADFNRAAWNRALAPIGERMPDAVKMGREAADYVANRIGDAYQSVVPHLRLSNIHGDPQFVSDLAGVVAEAKSGILPPDKVAQFEGILRSQILGKLGAAGTSTDGEVINSIDSMLGKLARDYAKDPSADVRHLGDLLSDAQGAFRDLLERQNPAEAPALKAAREAYANYVRVARAAASTGTSNAEGIFTPAQLNAAVRADDSTTRKLGYSRGKALLQDLSDAGMVVLPSKYPDSGTAGRTILNSLLLGGLGGYSYAERDPATLLKVLGIGGTLAAPYLPRINNLTNAVMGRLAQTAGPARNMLASTLQRGAGAVAPMAGRLATATAMPPPVP